jgi:hypothetical protein
MGAPAGGIVPVGLGAAEDRIWGACRGCVPPASRGMQAVSELSEMECAGFAGVREELALGVLTGRERAEALAHLGCCAACREDVRRLTVTGEELLRLLPAGEPPPGFETRVLELLGLTAHVPGPGSRPGLVARAARAAGARTGLVSAGHQAVGTVFPLWRQPAVAVDVGEPGRARRDTRLVLAGRRLRRLGKPRPGR